MSLHVTYFNTLGSCSDILTLSQMLNTLNIGNAADNVMPTIKNLQNRNDLIARVECNDSVLMLYQCGLFIYSIYHRFTIQRVEKCLKPVLYYSVTGEILRVELSSFLELPFYIRLSMDGMRRITSNQYDQLDKRILSTDAIGIESIDLVDKDSDFFSKSIEMSDDYEVKTKLINSLKILTDRQRKLLALRYINNLSYQGIADLLKCSKQSVYESIQSAIRKIRAYFYTSVPNTICDYNN